MKNVIIQVFNKKLILAEFAEQFMFLCSILLSCVISYQISCPYIIRKWQKSTKYNHNQWKFLHFIRILPLQ